MKGAALMDPLTATSAATGVAKSVGSAAGKQMLALLAKRTQRFRVAWAVSRAAKTEGILVGWTKLGSWLNTADVRTAISSGEPKALRESAERLALKVKPTGPDIDAAAARIVDLVRDESLRRMAEGDALVTQTRRLEHKIESTALLTAGGDEAAFTSALEKLHPWRAQTAGELATHWNPFRALVVTLVGERDRRTLLQQWGNLLPASMADAPAEVLCWFACVAADYGADETALQLIRKGIEAGASAPYWWARAGLIIGTETAERSARARELWARSDPKHPLAEACEAIERGAFVTAEQVLDSWVASSPNDESIKAILLSAAATGRDDFNRAIAIGLKAAEEHPEGSGNILRTAEALLSRGHSGQSDHPLNDYARAFDFAIKARDSRRTWLGDSVAPILTAVTASALATDIDQAWRLTRATPEGTALAHEARDDRLRRESAILAATMGRFQNARSIADALGDPFVSYTVDGWQAFAEDRPADAEDAWLRAWDCAPNDTSRLQTAAALAPLGLRLPELDSLSGAYSRAIERIRTVHKVMSVRDDDMSLLRVRATDSEVLTVLLADRLMARGQIAEAAAVLEAGGSRWNDPLMMRKAAARYESAGHYDKAYDVAATALSLGGTAWAGRLETLMIQFESLESQGQFSRSLAVAREMVTLAPANLTVRWAFIHSLIRAGAIKEAWRALTHQGKPVDPRDPAEARTWIGLAAECDDSPEFVQRSLEMLRTWRHEPDLVGVFLLQIYRGMTRNERDVADSDIRELHKATEEYTEAHPESHIFRRIAFDPGDPLGPLTALLKDRASEHPAITELRERIARGELPLGFAAELAGRTYVEACIKTGAGLVYSHLPSMAATGRAAAAAASGLRIVIDASAAATLTLLDPATVDKLVGAFLALETTDAAYRDALGAQQSLSMLSTMSLGWDAEKNRPVVRETDAEEAKALARRADQVVELLARSDRRGWPGLKRFSGFAGEGTWLSALDLAISEQRVFWCDDRVLRQLAAHENAQTFGTVDLLATLEADGLLATGVGAAARARLIAGYHVDLDFDPDVMTLAAELDGWMPKGAAAALARVHTWTDPAKCLRFADTAISRIASNSPTDIAGWTGAVALGLVRITDGNIEGASDNLRLLLAHQLAQPWLRPDTLPFVMQGIRNAAKELPGTADPLPAVLARTYNKIAEKHGAPRAAKFLLMLVSDLSEEDRVDSARIILTSKG